MKKLIVLAGISLLVVSAFGMGKPAAAPAEGEACGAKIKATCGGPCAGSCGCEGAKAGAGGCECKGKPADKAGCGSKTECKDSAAKEAASCADGVCTLDAQPAPVAE